MIRMPSPVPAPGSNPSGKAGPPLATDSAKPNAGSGCKLMAIRPLPYFAALAINSLTMNPSGIAVAAGRLSSMPSLRALIRRQHCREVAAEVLKDFPELDRSHAVVGMKAMVDTRYH